MTVGGNFFPSLIRIMTSSAFTPACRVGDIVAAQPLLASIFQRAGIDYCCGGKITLAAACAARGLDAPTFLAALAAAPLRGLTDVVDAAAMTLTELADHIEATHHAYLKADLPILVEQADRVALRHGERDARLPLVAETVRALASDMLNHMTKEEHILFPLVRALENDGLRPSHCGSIANPIRQMESEHSDAGCAVARLRELTEGFLASEDACNTHRALLAGLARLEADLHQHVHKENNVLFPRAIALEAQIPT